MKQFINYPYLNTLHSGCNSCAVKMNRLSAAGCKDIMSFGSQLKLNCVV